MFLGGVFGLGWLYKAYHGELRSSAFNYVLSFFPHTAARLHFHLHFPLFFDLSLFLSQAKSFPDEILEQAQQRVMDLSALVVNSSTFNTSAIVDEMRALDPSSRPSHLITRAAEVLLWPNLGIVESHVRPRFD